MYHSESHSALSVQHLSWMLGRVRTVSRFRPVAHRWTCLLPLRPAQAETRKASWWMGILHLLRQRASSPDGRLRGQVFLHHSASVVFEVSQAADRLSSFAPPCPAGSASCLPIPFEPSRYVDCAVYVGSLEIQKHSGCSHSVLNCLSSRVHCHVGVKAVMLGAREGWRGLLLAPLAEGGQGSHSILAQTTWQLRLTSALRKPVRRPHKLSWPG